MPQNRSALVPNTFPILQLSGQIYDYNPYVHWDYSLIIACPQHMGQCIVNLLSYEVVCRKPV